MNYITSDWHFGHHNICGKDGFVSTRKNFKDSDEMNSVLIDAINSVVTSEDTIYHLGDISMNLKQDHVLDILKQLNGNLVLFKGNHDKSKLLKFLEKNNYKYNDDLKFRFIEVGTIIKANKKQYFLSHYPIGLGEERKKMRSICGHIHDVPARDKNCLNVGVDSPELPSGLHFGTPITFEQAFELVEEKYNKG